MHFQCCFMKLSKYFLIVICCILTIPAYLENNKIDEYLIEVVIFEHLNFLTNESLSSQNLDLEDFEIISLAEKKKSQINQSAINKSFKEKTIIISTHRLSCLRYSDRIIVLEHGKIIQEGNHSKLIQTEGYYKDLYYKQMKE